MREMKMRASGELEYLQREKKSFNHFSRDVDVRFSARQLNEKIIELRKDAEIEEKTTQKKILE